ncbi:MAG: hypothetical protein OXD54_16555 [Candidatus Poribacteria bacterium]|nr:hypothetical protein [Candidatus Poribacteria bacterium]
MSLIAQKISGCYRRVLIFLLIILIVIAGIGVILFNQVGGTEGLKYWTAGRALNGTERLILKNRPDGIPQEDVETQFETVLVAIGNRQIELKLLYDMLKSYQDKFHNPGLSSEKVKPSTPEIEEFLTNLGQTIVPDE